jgi:antitoxin VapB
MIAVAKVFRNGASQAVRLPREFRFAVKEVCIKRIGSAVLLFPKNKGWDLMSDAISKMDDDFLANRAQPTRPGKRKKL